VDPKLVHANDGGDRGVALGATSEALAAAMRSVPGSRWRSPPREPGDPVCTAGDGSLYINSDGEVWLCPVLPLSLGNVRARPLDRIWEESEARKEVLAHRWSDSPPCLACRINRFCERCPGDALQEHGDLTRPASADCRTAAAYAALWEAGNGEG
jgi:radical SAM protein with 4Fe4S-binding SPASM domain